MTPITADGRYYEGAVATAEGDETFENLAASENGAAFDIEEASALVVEVDVSAFTGTPTLDVKLQARVTADDAWIDVESFTQLDDVASEKRAIGVLGYGQGRFVKTVGGGSPDLTGSITVSKVR